MNDLRDKLFPVEIGYSFIGCNIYRTVVFDQQVRYHITCQTVKCGKPGPCFSVETEKSGSALRHPNLVGSRYAHIIDPVGRLSGQFLYTGGFSVENINLPARKPKSAIRGLFNSRYSLRNTVF